MCNAVLSSQTSFPSVFFNGIRSIFCRYPDDQMMTARATNVFDIFTGEVVTPVMLLFSNARKYNETLYKLKVDCQRAGRPRDNALRMEVARRVQSVLDGGTPSTLFTATWDGA
jgi:hypothetical protein